ncbi:MAG: sulfurtransferase [Deltaproteobacteria bacterium]|nr:sulfurtransferase [Deltaproteobacteria bacterium]
MKRITVLALIMMALSTLTLAVDTGAREIDPVVSTEWLAGNLSKDRLVVVDIRKLEEYKAGHIPGAINVFYNIWAPGRGDMKNELPLDDDLADVLVSNGIDTDSLVVIAGITDSGADKVNTTRVALTLIYAGVPNVAVLDGGYNKWKAENRAMTTDTVSREESEYEGDFNTGILIGKDELLKKIGKAVIVDVREPDFYTGEKKLEFVARAGHLKGAVNLPTISKVFREDGTYSDMAELSALAKKTLGDDTGREIVVYCDSGRVASAWWYLLREVVGYSDVKLFDGSAEDWAKDESFPMEK